MATNGKRTPVSITKRFPIVPVVQTERLLVVVANAEQKKRYEQLRLYQKSGVLIMVAKDIQNTGYFGHELSGVEWKPGWALECDRPEVVVARVNRRLESNGRRIAL